MLYPRVMEDGKLVNEEQLVGVQEHLGKRRVLSVAGTIGREVDSQNFLLAMDSVSSQPIKLLISSPGGDLDTAFQLYDTFKLLKSPIYTLGRYCSSAAVLLLAAGKKRYLMPHAKVMIHLPSGQAYGDSRDWEIQHAEMEWYKNRMVDILMECGAKPSKEQILRDMDRDFWLDPQGAIDYGLADKIITPSVMQSWLKEEK